MSIFFFFTFCVYVCVSCQTHTHTHTLPPSFCCCNWAQVRLVGKPISLPRAFLTFWEHHFPSPLTHSHLSYLYFPFSNYNNEEGLSSLSLLSLAHSNSLHQRDLLLYLYFMRVLVCVDKWNRKLNLGFGFVLLDTQPTTPWEKTDRDKYCQQLKNANWNRSAERRHTRGSSSCVRCDPALELVGGW